LYNDVLKLLFSTHTAPILLGKYGPAMNTIFFLHPYHYFPEHILSIYSKSEESFHLSDKNPNSFSMISFGLNEKNAQNPLQLRILGI